MTHVQPASAISTLDGIEDIHIVGIGGAGMSAIARILHGWGLTVHGSDRRVTPLTASLAAEGIAVAQGHAPANVGAADLVLASSAVPDDNPELVAAHERGIRVARRPEFLTALTAGYDVIAVAGAHGKTTVTGMIASILSAADLDPTYIVGGVVADLGTNGQAGSGRYFVIEADEYRRTFLALRPSVAVVTNVEFDHPDCFPDMRHLRLAFGEFVDNMVPGGLLVACGDDEIARAIAAAHHAGGGRVRLYGFDPAGTHHRTGTHHRAIHAAWSARDLLPNTVGGFTFTAVHEGVALGSVALCIPGAFNVANALAALAVAEEVGVDFDLARDVLARFSGTARRFEILGEVAGVTVIDDYAHHPTQIRGNLTAARQRYGDRRLVAVWEPHTFSRIRALHEAFMTAFRTADEVVVMPIYAAREVDDGTLSAEDLAQQVEHPSVRSADTLEAAVAQLTAICEPGDVVLMMGAGNEYLAGRELVAALRQREIG